MSGAREEAASLMEYLPPVGWADVTTKRDLDSLETRVNLRHEGLGHRFTALEHNFDAKLQAELRCQTLTMLSAIVAMLAVLGALAGIF